MERLVGSHLLGSFANRQFALPENQVGGSLQDALKEAEEVPDA